MLKEQIKQLNDKTAVHILNIIAKSRMQTEDVETEASAELVQALQSEFAVEPAEDEAAPGDLARDTLLLLADDPAFKDPLMNMLTGPQAKGFGVDPIVATAVITAALVILQTRVKIEYDKKGKWSFLVERKAASDSLLKSVVQKIGGLMSRGS